MDVDRPIGPLSYEVDAPDGEASAERPIIAGGLVAGLGLVVSLVAGWFALGFVDNPGLVVRGFPLLIVVLAVGVAFVRSRGLLRRARRIALAVVTTIALASALLTNRGLGSIKEALPQVRYAIDSVDLPPGFTLVSEATHGDRFCRHGCPTVERRYAAPPTDPDPVSTFILAMFAQGWEPTSDVEPRLATIAARGNVTAQLQETEPHIVDITVQRRS
jgi:hypothetical protein